MPDLDNHSGSTPRSEALRRAARIVCLVCDHRPARLPAQEKRGVVAGLRARLLMDATV